MKKTLIFFSMILVFLAGCKKQETRIIDYYPINIGFQVVDANGNDMLDPSNSNNILGDVQIQYNGTAYSCKVPSKAYMESFNGLTLSNEKYGSPALYVMNLGEFSPIGDYRNKTFCIDFGDGTGTHTVEFTFYVSKKNAMNVIHEFKFNGETNTTNMPIFKYTIH